MAEKIEQLDRRYRDRNGVVVHVIGYDREGQRVIYNRTGYEWECAAPLIVFRARFTRIDV
ncbi:DUF4222 domain-containing protein [Serratia proteamaculans]|uniref:DUF4222 domain-containing protein n=1 Tax=Serratia proteamaculans TaxID=28151 RepID=UPI001021013F|nr:DUF4222 domain-containing protein [Serratia proteamaculans]RYM48022.1 DUF4222 domain-containing protein [Serratia proteamaculans]